MSVPGATRGPAARSGGYSGDAAAMSGGSTWVVWLLARATAVLLLFGASGLLYYVAASDAFAVTEVGVAGSQLVPAAEIEQIAAVTGLNIFWLREEEVGQRLQAIAAVHSAQVRAVLPNRLEVRIVERAPVAVWEKSGTSYLVDEAGRVLRATDQPVVLPTIRDTSARPIDPAGGVDGAALKTMFHLQQLLPRAAALTPRDFEYSPETGVTVVADSGARVRFGRSEDLEWKVSALVAIRRELERQGQRPELIDLRFKDRPYVR